MFSRRDIIMLGLLSMFRKQSKSARGPVDISASKAALRPSSSAINHDLPGLARNLGQSIYQLRILYISCCSA